MTSATRAPTSGPYGRGDLSASLVMIAPVLLAYEVGVLFAGRVDGVDLVSRVIYVLAGGRTGYLLVHALIAAAFLLWIRRGQRWAALSLDQVGPVTLEAAVYALTLGATITLALRGLAGVLHAPSLLALGATRDSAISALGAGVHEELVFRLGIMSALVALLGRLPRNAAVALALVASSLVFALAHHVGTYGEPFTVHAFAFRTLAGLAFGAIFWFRSLAHAVYAHVLYDLIVAWT